MTQNTSTAPSDSTVTRDHTLPSSATEPPHPAHYPSYLNTSRIKTFSCPFSRSIFHELYSHRDKPDKFDCEGEGEETHGKITRSGCGQLNAAERTMVNDEEDRRGSTMDDSRRFEQLGKALKRVYGRQHLLRIMIIHILLVWSRLWIMKSKLVHCLGALLSNICYRFTSRMRSFVQTA